MSATSLASPKPETDPEYVTLTIWRLSVAAYHSMIEHGILGSDDPVELLEGLLVTKLQKTLKHRFTKGELHDALRPMIPQDCFLGSQDAVTTDDSEPEPDISLVRGARRQFARSHPTAENVVLVGEVADVSLDRDRGIKKRIYARAGIAVYWIVNLVDSIIEVYTLPSGPTEIPDYGNRQDFGIADAVPVILDGVEVGRIAVKDVLP
jgi:Uma2 family endonuclease